MSTTVTDPRWIEQLYYHYTTPGPTPTPTPTPPPTPPGGLTTDIINFMANWANCESGGGGGAFNPLNYTLPYAGSTTFNAAGVQNYTTFENGVTATQIFLGQTNMQAFTAAIEAGNLPQAGAALDAFYSSWGGPNIYETCISTGTADGTLVLPNMSGHTMQEFITALFSTLAPAAIPTEPPGTTLTLSNIFFVAGFEVEPYIVSPPNWGGP